MPGESFDFSDLLNDREAFNPYSIPGFQELRLDEFPYIDSAHASSKRCKNANTGSASSAILEKIPQTETDIKHYTDTLTSHTHGIAAYNPSLHAYDFKYIEAISGMVDALGKIKRGKDDIFAQIYDDVRQHTGRYFNINSAIKAIQQNGRKHSDNAVIKSLKVIDLISSCDILETNRGILFTLQNMVKTYSSETHPWRKDRCDVDNVDEAMTDLSYKLNSFKEAKSEGTEGLKTPILVICRYLK